MQCFYFHLLLFFSLVSAGFSSPSLYAAQDATPEEEPVPAEKFGKLTLTLDPGGHTAAIVKVFFTPDSKQLLSLGMDHAIRFWDVTTGQALKTLYPPGRGGLAAAALSPDGKRLALASIYHDGETPRHLVYLLSLSDGQVERVLHGHADKIKALAFSADGKRLASASQDGFIRLWDPNKDSPLKVIKSKYCHHLALSPDGTRLAGLDKVKSGAILNTATGRLIAKIDGHVAVAWSADGKTLATASAGKLQLWKPDGSLRRQVLDGKLIDWIGFSNDSQTVLAVWTVAGFLRAALIDVDTGESRQEYSLSSIKASAARDGVLSPDGLWAATGGGGVSAHEVVLWKTDTGTLHHRLQAKSWITFRTSLKAAWSADGQSVSWNNHARFHFAELRFGAPIPEKEAQRARWKQGDLILEKVSKSGAIKVLKAGQELARLELESISDATLIGKDQAALAGKRGRFWLFDAQTGKVVRRFAPTIARSIAPSPDGRFLLSVSTHEQTLRIYQLDREQPLLSVYAHGPDWIVWTPEGYYAATPGGERLMGWTVDNGMKQMPAYFPAARFHKTFYRPDVIQRVLEKGSLAAALQAADQARGQKSSGIKLEQVLPPRVVLSLRAQDKAAVTLKVQAEAAVPEQPILSLRLLLDGRVVPGKETLCEYAVGQAKAEVEWTFTLPDGAHQLAVLARGPDSAGVSPPLRLHNVESQQRPALHVLTVGINQYQDGTLDLKYAAPDAEALARAFAKHCQGEPFRIVTSRTLLNQDATVPKITKALADLRQTVAQEDLVIVFLACHGVRHQKEYYLLTHETDTDRLAQTALSGASLRRALADYKCQVLLMLDACHAAGFGASKKLARLGLKPATDEVARDLTEDEVGIAVMCAAMANEKAEGHQGHGLFTHALLDALAKKPGVPFNPRNQRLYVHHLQSYVFDEVSGRSEERQHPFLSMPWVVESFVVR